MDTKQVLQEDTQFSLWGKTKECSHSNESSQACYWKKRWWSWKGSFKQKQPHVQRLKGNKIGWFSDTNSQRSECKYRVWLDIWILRTQMSLESKNLGGKKLWDGTRDKGVLWERSGLNIYEFSKDCCCQNRKWIYNVHIYSSEKPLNATVIIWFQH